MEKVVYAWRCGCSKTTTAIDYANKKLAKPNNKVIYACPTIQLEQEVKRKLGRGVVINANSMKDDEIRSRIAMNKKSGWALIDKRNELLRTEKCLIVTHARLMFSDPIDFYDVRYMKGSRDIIIDEFAMKLRKFYIQRATLLAYIVHPHHEVPRYITYENTFDENHKRRENYWQAWEDDMESDVYKRVHKVRVSKKLLKKELQEMFPLWFPDFVEDCKKQRLWLKTLETYERLALTFRRTYALKKETKSKVTDYSRWLWLTPKELQENGMDLSDILGSTYNMLDDSQYRWEGQLYSKLKKVYHVFNYQKTVTYAMLMIARQIAKDEYFDTDIRDNHPGYYVGGFNPMERWLLQHSFKVTCLDGSATIFKDVYEHYGFKIINNYEKSIVHYADNLECRMFNFKSFSQTSICSMSTYEIRKLIALYISPYLNWAKCWYVIVPSKCTDLLIKVFSKVYGKDKVCNCTVKKRNEHSEGEEQITINKALASKPKAKFIFVNPEGQCGSNAFLHKCDGILNLSQLNFPKNINKMYSEYYGIEDFNSLYSAHLIYQESCRAKNRLMKAANYKEGHKIPFICLTGMPEEQFKIFNRLNTHTKIFDKNETTNLKRMILF